MDAAAALGIDLTDDTHPEVEPSKLRPGDDQSTRLGCRLVCGAGRRRTASTTACSAPSVLLEAVN